MENVLLQTDLQGYGLKRQGKVRDIYDNGTHLFLIATDRVSAFDVVLSNGIPGKGKVLTQISEFWFEKTEGIIPNHLERSPDYGHFLYTFFDENPKLAGRTMFVKKAKPLPVECIVRGYLSGSGWKEYQKNRTICDIELPPGLVESSKLPEPIFTPSTKEEKGLHDRNISFDEMANILRSTELANKLKEISLSVYFEAWEYAIERGIIIADTKLEFGFDDKTGKLMIIDEILTPDSSRFWSSKNYKPGGPQDSYDKQPIRDFLIGESWKGAENGTAPELPEWLIKQTSKRYQEILEMLRP